MPIENLEPREVARLIDEGAVLLVDVREPAEFAAEHIAGARLFPLSAFDPAALPEPGDRKLVFQCGSGVRSARAVAACTAAGLACNMHMRGGIQAWKAAGLPTVTGAG